MKKIAILGSTGSIGTQTLDVISKKEDLEVVGISAGSNIEMLEAQIRRFHPLLAAVGDEKKAQELKIKVADTNWQGSRWNGWTFGTCSDGRV